MSASNTALQITNTAAPAIATVIATHIAGSAAAGAGAAAAAAGGSAAGVAAGSAWVPFIGPAIAGVTLAIGLWLNRKGPGQKIASTAIVNDLEPLLEQNRDAYLASNRTVSEQAQALKNFDDAWAWLTSAAACGSAELGNPGRACIADRQAGGRWDWFAYYRDPIAADTPRPDYAPVTDSLSEAAERAAEILGLSNDSQEGNGSLLLGAALVALALTL